MVNMANAVEAEMFKDIGDLIQKTIIKIVLEFDSPR